MLTFSQSCADCANTSFQEPRGFGSQRSANGETMGAGLAARQPCRILGRDAGCMFLPPPLARGSISNG